MEKINFVTRRLFWKCIKRLRYKKLNGEDRIRTWWLGI